MVDETRVTSEYILVFAQAHRLDFLPDVDKVCIDVFEVDDFDGARDASLVVMAIAIGVGVAVVVGDKVCFVDGGKGPSAYFANDGVAPSFYRPLRCFEYCGLMAAIGFVAGAFSAIVRCIGGQIRVGAMTVQTGHAAVGGFDGFFGMLVRHGWVFCCGRFGGKERLAWGDERLCMYVWCWICNAQLGILQKCRICNGGILYTVYCSW